jgi:uncharacterized protein (UPF0332 family)
LCVTRKWLPPDPEELLQQADTLAGTGGAANQADLRRAVSAAYYAVFHFCLTAAADMVCGTGARSTDRYSLVYRSVDHSRLRSLCTSLKGTQPQVSMIPVGGYGQIADFARNASNLYETRCSADYDPSRTYSAAEVKVAISDARQAINWFQAGTPEQQKAFLTLLLFKAR